jgi:hypothetical protein
MMVDTGATCTLISDALADQLGVRPLRYRSIVGVSGVPEDRPVYRMAIGILMAPQRGEPAIATFEADVVGMPEASPGAQHQGLLGRDFLQFMRLVYDGPTGTFELQSRDTRQPEAPRQGTKQKAKSKKKRQQSQRSKKKNRPR